MNLEAINKWLDEEYGCSYTKLEELHDFYFEKYCDLQQENKILKENAENNDKVVDKVNWENMLLKKENKQLKSIIYELREHMLDIDYKMGWEYVEYLDRLLPEKILKEISDE